jgi:hypothetical protein
MSQRFSIDTIRDPRQLYPLLQRLSDDLDAANRRIADLQIRNTEPTLSINSLLAIRDALQSTGAARLNVAQLPGILAQSQRAFAVVADSASTLPNPALYEVGTIGAVLSGSTLTFYLVTDTMPRSWVAQTSLAITAIDNSFTIQDDADPTKKLRFEASTITTGTTRVMTVPDTNQILAGRDVNNLFSLGQTITNALNAALILLVQNTNATDSGAAGQARFAGDTSILDLFGHGTARTVVRCGITLGNWTEILSRVGNGLLISTNGATPIVFGTNDTERGRVDSAGLWTLSVAGKTLLIKPPSAPAANTLMFEIQTSAAASVASIDIEGDLVVRDASVRGLTATADSTVTGGSTALTVNGTNGLTAVVVFDVKHSGSTVFEVTGDGDVHLTNNLDVDGNLNADGDATVDGSLRLGPATSRLFTRASDPNGALSASSGDYCFRTDTPSTALQRLYVCTGGTSWTGIA